MSTTETPTLPLTDANGDTLVVALLGQDGNAYNLLGIMKRSMERSGNRDHVAAFMAEATAGDYNWLLATCMKWAIIE